MKAMTLNLPDDDMLKLEALAKSKELSKNATIRNAIRLYCAISDRLGEGERIKFVKPDGTEVEALSGVPA